MTTNDQELDRQIDHSIRLILSEIEAEGDDYQTLYDAMTLLAGDVKAFTRGHDRRKQKQST